MFTEGERSDLRDQLVAVARSDERIDAAALVGSAARDGEDEWSDIDLALRLAADLSPWDVAAEWTTRMYGAHGAVAHLDIWSGPTLFRVFLLASSLQIDLSFWPAEAFADSGGSFRLLFGEANEPAPPPARVRTPSSAWAGCMPFTLDRVSREVARCRLCTCLVDCASRSSHSRACDTDCLLTKAAESMTYPTTSSKPSPTRSFVHLISLNLFGHSSLSPVLCSPKHAT